MITYAGTGSAKRALGETIWLALVTLVAATALVLALVAMQRVGVTHRGSSLTVPSTIPTVVYRPSKSTGKPWTPPKPIIVNGTVCHQCMP